MSREIKFRAWFVENQIMYSWEDLINRIGISESIFIETELWKPMQYTGLKDEKGVEGYHQDITEDSNGDRYEVAWDEDDATHYLRAIGLNVCDKELRAIKEQRIIGNIYQHPELLKK